MSKQSNFGENANNQISKSELPNTLPNRHERSFFFRKELPKGVELTLLLVAHTTAADAAPIINKLKTSEYSLYLMEQVGHTKETRAYLQRIASGQVALEEVLNALDAKSSQYEFMKALLQALHNSGITIDIADVSEGRLGYQISLGLPGVKDFFAPYPVTRANFLKAARRYARLNKKREKKIIEKTRKSILKACKEQGKEDFPFKVLMALGVGHEEMSEVMTKQFGASHVKTEKTDTTYELSWIFKLLRHLEKNSKFQEDLVDRAIIHLVADEVLYPLLAVVSSNTLKITTCIQQLVSQIPIDQIPVICRQVQTNEIEVMKRQNQDRIQKLLDENDDPSLARERIDHFIHFMIIGRRILEYLHENDINLPTTEAELNMMIKHS